MCKRIVTPEGEVCEDHGAAWTEHGCLTLVVLAGVAEHRQFQFENYGANRDVPDGTGKDVEWLQPVVDLAQSAYTGPFTAFEIEGLFREEWDFPKGDKTPEQDEARAAATWMRMLREEVAEAFAQDDPRWLEAELTQVAALAVSWIEKIREREIYQYGVPLRDGTGVFTMAEWRSPGDVYREQHGQDHDRSTPVKIVRRRLGGEWEEVR